jgi:hypothetical protein
LTVSIFTLIASIIAKSIAEFTVALWDGVNELADSAGIVVDTDGEVKIDRCGGVPDRSGGRIDVS